MKNLKWFIIIIALVLIIGIYFTINPIIKHNCCECTPDFWLPNSAIYTFIENLKIKDCGDCSDFSFGCSVSYYVIPIELVIIIFILLVWLLKMRLSKNKKVGDFKDK